MLTTSVAALFRLFLGALLLGVCFGLCYDLLRITRVLMGVHYSTRSSHALSSLPQPPFVQSGQHRAGMRLRDAIVGFEDFIFCLTVGVAVAIYLSAANHGRVRWLTFAGIALGFAGYYFTVGRLVIFFSEAIAALLRFCFLWLAWGIWLPLRGIGRGLGWMASRCGRGMQCMWRHVWLPCYTRCRMRRDLRRLSSVFQKSEMEGRT